MFNIGPLELMVLAIVALIVLGPEKLPGFIRDATRMLRTLREMATGAREQLRDELGPEFADVDFRNLNPRTAITRAVFGDEPPDLQKYNPRNFDARSSARDLLYGRDEQDAPISMTKSPNGSSANGHSANGHSANGHSANGHSANGHSANGAADRPRPRPRPQTPPSGGSGYDSDAT